MTPLPFHPSPLIYSSHPLTFHPSDPLHTSLQFSHSIPFYPSISCHNILFHTIQFHSTPTILSIPFLCLLEQPFPSHSIQAVISHYIQDILSFSIYPFSPLRASNSDYYTAFILHHVSHQFGNAKTHINKHTHIKSIAKTN